VGVFYRSEEGQRNFTILERTRWHASVTNSCGNRHLQVMPARERARKGKLVPIWDKGVPRVLATGDPVMARFKGDDAQAYYPGFATELLDNWQWHIIYDNRGEEDLFVRQSGKIVPDIMHLDGTYVKMPKVARATLLRKKSSKGAIKVVHTGSRRVQRQALYNFLGQLYTT
jgi:hypothetical protein